MSRSSPSLPDRDTRRRWCSSRASWFHGPTNVPRPARGTSLPFVRERLEPSDRCAYCRESLRRSDKQTFWVMTVANHGAVDRCLIVPVESQAGEILQAHVVVVIDLRIGHPCLEMGALAGEGAEELFGGIETDFTE